MKSFVDLKNIHHSSERSSHSFIEDRRKLLQVYLQELALIPSIKDCPAFKQFLNLDEQFPELKEEEVTSKSVDKENSQVIVEEDLVFNKKS